MNEEEVEITKKQKWELIWLITAIILVVGIMIYI